MAWTWADEVSQALDDLGGEAHICEIVLRIRLRGRKMITNESSIRDALERHCPDKYFGTGIALFYHKGHDRSGLYGLISKTSAFHQIRPFSVSARLVARSATIYRRQW